MLFTQHVEINDAIRRMQLDLQKDVEKMGHVMAEQNEAIDAIVKEIVERQKDYERVFTVIDVNDEPLTLDIFHIVIISTWMCLMGSHLFAWIRLLKKKKVENWTDQIQASKKPGSCRVCLEEDDDMDLISPCACAGSQQNIHRKCFRLWITRSGNATNCPTCKTNYNVKKQVPSC
jgi:hypothetical protein